MGRYLRPNLARTSCSSFLLLLLLSFDSSAWAVRKESAEDSTISAKTGMAKVGPPSTWQRATVDPCGVATSGRGAGRGPCGGAFCLWRRTLRALLLHLPRLFRHSRGVLCAVVESRCRSGSDAQLPVSPPRALASLPTTAGTGCTACSHHNEATLPCVWCGGVVWCGVVWCGVVWCGVVWCGVVWCGVVWCGVVWCGVVWCGVVWCGVVWCGVVWCGVVWCGVVWCGVVGGGGRRGEVCVWRWWFGRDIEQTHTCKYAPNYGCHVPVDKNPTPCTCVQGSQNCRRLSRREQTRDTLNATMRENYSATWRRAVQKKTPLCAYAEASANAKASSINRPLTA